MSNLAIDRVLAKIPKPKPQDDDIPFVVDEKPAPAPAVEAESQQTVEESIIAGLPESSSIELDMDWAYANVGIDRPDFRTAPSRSSKFMWEYARTARSEFLTRYMAMKAKSKEAAEEGEKIYADSMTRMTVIDAIIRKLPQVAKGDLAADELSMIMGLP